MTEREAALLRKTFPRSHLVSETDLTQFGLATKRPPPMSSHPAVHVSLARQLFSNQIWETVAFAAKAFFVIGLTPWMLRVWGAQGYGKFAFASSLFVLLAILDFGCSQPDAGRTLPHAIGRACSVAHHHGTRAGRLRNHFTRGGRACRAAHSYRQRSTSDGSFLDRPESSLHHHGAGDADSLLRSAPRTPCRFRLDRAFEIGHRFRMDRRDSELSPVCFRARGR